MEMMIFYLLTGMVCTAYAVLILRYGYGWECTPENTDIHNTPFQTKVTILLPVRNEEKNIEAILKCLLKQDYPGSLLEILVIDDHSEDHTAERVKEMSGGRIRLLNLEASEGKKQAIAEGVRQAGGDLIITTDADCRMGDDWVRSIVAFYEKNHPKMIIGPVLTSSSNNFLDAFQQQEMAVLTASACGSAYFNRPLLCSGANLAYEKKAFEDVSGFKEVDQIPSGDDQFLMLKIHNRFHGSVRYLKNRKAMVWTFPEQSFMHVFFQRKRWASKTFSYGWNHVTGAAILIFFMNFFILTGGILSIINLKFVYALIPAISVKCMVDYMLIGSALRFFNMRVHFSEFILASFLYPPYVILTGLLSSVSGYNWKDRRS